MGHHLLIVEGAHDAAFFGKLLSARGFAPVNNLNALPEFWMRAIPRSYPVRRDNALERVISFPEIYVREDNSATFGVVVANGDSSLLRMLRDILDLYDAPQFTSVAIVLDTDWQQSENQRYQSFKASTVEWNAKGEADGRPGFPVPFPNEPGTVHSVSPRVGIYLFPGDGAQGALEDVLLACANYHFPVLQVQAGALLEATHEAYPANADPDPFLASRKISGSAKARCGIIANALRPGSSLAVSIRDSKWLPMNEAELPQVNRAAQFLDALLAE